MPASCRLLDGDGHALAVHELSGDGDTALLVHGAGLDAGCFRPLARDLGGRFRCVGVDLAGHGRSGAATSYEWEVFAADVASVVTALEGPLALGLGHSLGATALLAAEARHPSFSALYCYEPIVFSPLLQESPPEGLAERARRRKARFPSRESAEERFRERAPFSDFDPEALAGYLDDGLDELADGTFALACAPDDEARIYEAALHFDLVSLLDRVTCPVTIACGEQSEVMSPEGAAVLAGRVNNGRVSTLPHLGHFGPFSDPDTVAASALHALDTARA